MAVTAERSVWEAEPAEGDARMPGSGETWPLAAEHESEPDEPAGAGGG